MTPASASSYRTLLARGVGISRVSLMTAAGGPAAVVAEILDDAVDRGQGQ